MAIGRRTLLYELVGVASAAVVGGVVGGRKAYQYMTQPENPTQPKPTQSAPSQVQPAPLQTTLEKRLSETASSMWSSRDLSSQQILEFEDYIEKFSGDIKQRGATSTSHYGSWNRVMSEMTHSSNLATELTITDRRDVKNPKPCRRYVSVYSISRPGEQYTLFQISNLDSAANNGKRDVIQVLCRGGYTQDLQVWGAIKGQVPLVTAGDKPSLIQTQGAQKILLGKDLDYHANILPSLLTALYSEARQAQLNKDFRQGAQIHFEGQALLRLQTLDSMTYPTDITKDANPYYLIIYTDTTTQRGQNAEVKIRAYKQKAGEGPFIEWVVDQNSSQPRLFLTGYSTEKSDYANGNLNYFRSFKEGPGDQSKVYPTWQRLMVHMKRDNPAVNSVFTKLSKP